MNVDFKIYNLVYFRKADERKFFVRRVSSTDYVLIDSVTFEKINQCKITIQNYVKKNR